MKKSPNEKLGDVRVLANLKNVSINQILKDASLANRFLNRIEGQWYVEYSPNENDAYDYDRATNAVAFFIGLLHNPETKYQAESALALASSRSQRTKRLRKSISQMTNLQRLTDCVVLFGTLTFTNECLQATAEATRRTYVSRYLKANYLEYRANIDYGSKTDREHYHFVALASPELSCDIQELEKLWTYGFSKIKPVRPNSEASTARYVNKLSNHATKVAPRLIYSRISGKNASILKDYDLIDNWDALPF